MADIQMQRACSLNLSDFDNPYMILDKLPEKLFAPVVTHSMGLPAPRANSLLAIRDNLLKGTLPSSTLPWPNPQVQQGLLEALSRLGIARFCYQNEEVTDALLIDILKVLEEQNGVYLRKYTGFFERLKRQELARLQDEQERKRRRGRKKSSNPNQRISLELSSEQLFALERRAKDESWEQLLPDISTFLMNGWKERISIWQELEGVFRDLQLVAQLGYDLSKGMLKSHGWLDIVRLRELLDKLPELREVIRSLGQMQQIDGEPVVETILELVRRVREEVQEIKTPFAPMEVQGITRSDSISRMLPQEAALLTHPTLKKLWHAKRAEHALLSYAVEGVEQQTVLMDGDALDEVTKEGRSKRFERGPILICLDTSGSMSGSPEKIAKALVLETLRVAGSEKRDCYVYLFGSTDEVSELELSRDAKGMEKLIGFLSMSFGGGTDVQGPLELALERCKETQWRKADILLVSDGVFGYGDTLLQKIKRRRKSHGLRVHGVLVGSGSIMMEKLCDPLHCFDKWSSLLR